ANRSTRDWSICSQSVVPRSAPARASRSAGFSTIVVISGPPGCAVCDVRTSGVLARDRHDLAGHVRGEVAREEHHDVRDLPGLGRTAERLPRLELLEEA